MTKSFCIAALNDLIQRLEKTASEARPLHHMLVLPKGETITVPELGGHAIGLPRDPPSPYEFGRSTVVTELPPQDCWVSKLPPLCALPADQEFSPYRPLAVEPYRLHLFFGECEKSLSELVAFAAEVVGLAKELGRAMLQYAYYEPPSEGCLIYGPADCIHGEQESVIDRWACTMHWWAWKVTDSPIHIQPRIVFGGRGIAADFHDESVREKLAYSTIEQDVFRASIATLRSFLRFMEQPPEITWASTYPPEDSTESQPAGSDDISLSRRHNSGLYGVVWEARQETLNRRVAVKVIKPEMTDAATAREHALALAKVQHPNVVTVFHLASIPNPDGEGDVDAVVMEWLEGKHLGERLKGESFTLDEAVGTLKCILAGIRAVHDSGLAHGDLHAGNVVLTEDAVKIIDISYAESGSFSILTSRSVEESIQADVASVAYLFRVVLHRTNFDITAISDEVNSLPSCRTLDEVGSILELLTNESKGR